MCFKGMQIAYKMLEALFFLEFTGFTALQNDDLELFFSAVENIPVHIVTVLIITCYRSQENL